MRNDIKTIKDPLAAFLRREGVGGQIVEGIEINAACQRIKELDALLGTWVSHDGHVCPNCGMPDTVSVRIAELERHLRMQKTANKDMSESYEQRIAELEQQLNGYIRGKSGQRIKELEKENESLRAECGLRQIQGFKEGMERAAEVPYVPPKLGNPTHGYTCGYNDGWYAKKEAIRKEIE